MTDVDVFSLPNDEEIKRLEIIMEESLANPGNSIAEEELVRDDDEERYVDFDIEEIGEPIQVIDPTVSTAQEFTEAFKQFKIKKNNPEVIAKPSNNYELIDVDKIDKQLDNIINKKSKLNDDTLIIKFKRCSNETRHKQLTANLSIYYHYISYRVYANKTHVTTNKGSNLIINFDLDEFEEFNQAQINELVNENYCLYRNYDHTLYVPQKLINTTIQEKINILTCSPYINYDVYQKYGDYWYLKTSTTSVGSDNSYKLSDISSYSIKTLKDIVTTEDFIRKKESVESVLTNLFGDGWYYVKVDNSLIEKNLYTRIVNLNNGYITYLIHFPEINIVNSKSDKHTIKDLYVCLIFDLQYRLCGKMRGFKTSFSAVEIVNHYIHSHLTTREAKGANSMFINKTEFCVGIGQPIELALVKLNNTYDEELLTSLCMQLESYLSWESLEGTPCVRIESLVKQNKYRPYIHRKIDLPNQQPRNNQIFDLIKNKSFEYYVNDNKIKIKDIIKNNTSTHFLNREFVKLYVNNNQYYTNINENSSSNNLENHDYVIRYKRYLDETLSVCNNKHENTTIKCTYIDEENDREYQQVDNLFEIRDFLDYIEYLIN